MKMIVFDINGTLLERLKKTDKINKERLDNKNIFPSHKLTNYYIYLRPHIQILANFLHHHKIKYIFWTTCTQKNAENLVDILAEIFTEYKGFLCQDDCKKGLIRGNAKAEKWIKDMDVVKRKFGCDGILVDDSLEKKVEGQEFIYAKTFDGEPDNFLLELCDILHDYYPCYDLDCIKKFKK